MGSRELSGKLAVFTDPLAALDDSEIAAFVAAGGDIAVVESAVAALDTGSSVKINVRGVSREVVSLASVVGAVKYVDRGDPAAGDFTEATLAARDAWTDLDLSAIVPASATVVHLFVFGRAANPPKGFIFRAKGNVNGLNVRGINAVVANLLDFAEMLIPLNAGRVIQYNFETATDLVLTVVVAGWLLPVA